MNSKLSTALITSFISICCFISVSTASQQKTFPPVYALVTSTNAHHESPPFSVSRDIEVIFLGNKIDEHKIKIPEKKSPVRILINFGSKTTLEAGDILYLAGRSHNSMTPRGIVESPITYSVKKVIKRPNLSHDE